MARRTSHDPGLFSWVELTTTDPAGAKAFYGELFGWEAEDAPIPDGGTYTLMRLGGDQVAGLFEQRDEERSQGIPPHWNSYVTVADADECAAKVAPLGGTVLMGPFDVMQAGRMAVLQDPTGAVFYTWQPRESIGAERVNEPGALSWNDLMTNDPAAAVEFYTQLFGWTAEEIVKEPISYTIWKVGDRSNGGMMRLTEQHGGAPPHWLPYFAVESCDDAVALTAAAGGRPLADPMDVPNGRFAPVQDPQGAAFAVFEGELDP